MSARAFLTARPNSFIFEDRLLVLDQPAKVGRSHKDDRSDSGNCFFDCKVLSRAHAKFLFDEGKFYLVDTSSSNGSFVNNIRLSKCGEESKVTQVYTGDLIRFGSDVVDKAKNVTQKCIVAKLKLFYPDGEECEGRPTSSRLFRPAESQEASGGLQEALAREKALEEELIRVKSTQGGTVQDGGELEKVLGEKAMLGKRLGDIEQMLEDRERFCNTVISKQKEDATEIAQLRQMIDNQNADIGNLEIALGDTQAELERAPGDSQGAMDELVASYDTKLRSLESSFEEERSQIRQQLHDVSANEIVLLNKIKSLESEQEYAQAEVDKVVVKETGNFEHQQGLEYRIQCLNTELAHTKMLLSEAKANKVSQRAEEDIAALASQEENIGKLRTEVAYIKKELIESRSKNAAAEDNLNTVKGTVETMTNSANALNNEIVALNLTVKGLREELGETTVKAEHLEGLVANMEAEPGVEGKSKVEIADLKAELAASQLEVKTKVDDILGLKDLLRLEKETVQTKEIDISRLHGQVSFIEEEMEQVKKSSGDSDTLQAEINSLRNRMNLVVDELEVTRGDNEKLSSELQQQQLLYTELKKMRGRGEEVELLQQTQRDVVAARDMAEDYHQKWQRSQGELERLGEERQRLLREAAQLRSQQPEVVPASASAEVPALAPASASEAVMANIGSLKLWEVLLGTLFISALVSWGFN